ncbi:MAG: hypothetical protein R3A46_07340 [Thermomicrobiales bacterium]
MMAAAEDAVVLTGVIEQLSKFGNDRAMFPLTQALELRSSAMSLGLVSTGQ